MGELQIRGDTASALIVEWTEGYKRVSWDLMNDESLVPTLRDILATIEPNNQGPLFLAPADRHPAAVLSVTTARESNPGAEAADKAAREAEMALRNGGAAISMGVGFEGVPTYDNPEDIPPVNWGV